MAAGGSDWLASLHKKAGGARVPRSEPASFGGSRRQRSRIPKGRHEVAGSGRRGFVRRSYLFALVRPRLRRTPCSTTGVTEGMIFLALWVMSVVCLFSPLSPFAQGDTNLSAPLRMAGGPSGRPVPTVRIGIFVRRAGASFMQKPPIKQKPLPEGSGFLGV